MIPANCPSCVFCSAQCPTAKGGGRVCEFHCHPGELEAAHLQQAARADPRVPGYVCEARKQRAPWAASDQGRHAVGSTGTVWGPRAGGHGTFPLHRGPDWLDPDISWPPLAAPECGTQPCLSKANSLSLNCGLKTGKKFNQERIAIGKMMCWTMLLSYPVSDMYLSLPATSRAYSSWSKLCFASQVINCQDSFK